MTETPKPSLSTSRQLLAVLGVRGELGQDALKAAAAKDVRPKDAASRGEPFQRTPLYHDIPWELLLPARKRTDAVIAGPIGPVLRAVA